MLLLLADQVSVLLMRASYQRRAFLWTKPTCIDPAPFTVGPEVGIVLGHASEGFDKLGEGLRVRFGEGLVNRKELIDRTMHSAILI